jgi:hypothetical protein
LSTLAMQFAGSEVLVPARMAGVSNHIPEGRFEVYLHGTNNESARALVDTQGRNLSQNGGNFGGKIFTTNQINTAGEFAARNVEKLHDISPTSQTKPAIIGIAIPQDVAQMLRQRGLMTTTPIGDRSGQHQTVFSPGALKILQSKGFFFNLESGE